MKKKVLKEAFQTPKGTHDILPDDIAYSERIIVIAQNLANFYAFRRIQTPHLEQSELFSNHLGETTDIVEKQMYSFRTRGGDQLTLRPEGTAPVARAYIQHGMSSWPQPVKLYYYGSYFRHENPQRGRFREFGQFGFEILGENDPITDALIIRLCYGVLDELGFKNIAVEVNSMGDEESRNIYRKELTNYYRKKINSLCKDCKRRLKENPLRLLDCKEPGCVELKESAPQMIKYLSESSKRHFKELLEYLDEAKISYFINPHLVRGFDYYTGTVFETFINYEGVSSVEESMPTQEGEEPEKTQPSRKSAPISLASGGRYDKLVEMLGGKPTPAVGGALGIDRIIQEMKENGLMPPPQRQPHVFLVQLGPAAKKKSLILMEEFRKAGVLVGESLSRDSIKTQLKIAAKVECEYALILGQKEAFDGTIIMREMSTGMQETIFIDKVVDEVKSRLKKKAK